MLDRVFGPKEVVIWGTLAGSSDTRVCWGP